MGNFIDGIDSDIIVKDLLIFGVSGQIRDNQSRNKLAVLLREITTLKNISKYIDFECDFGKSSNKHICKQGVGWGHACLDRRVSRLQTMGISCCVNCANSIGYLYNLVLESDLPTYDKLYKKVIGFWRPRKGYSLPIELRSSLCLYHNCAGSSEKRRTFDRMKLLLSDLEKRAVNLNNSILNAHAKIDNGG